MLCLWRVYIFLKMSVWGVMANGQRIKITQRIYGFSLLEVLIAVVVLSIGLLGIAGLQLTGVRFAHSANLRYLAALQATDMADRMRANRPGVASGHYNNLSGIGFDPHCIEVGCTPAQMAMTDAFQWNTKNAASLPAGVGTVVSTGLNPVYTITVSWEEVGLGMASAHEQHFVLIFQP